MIQLSNEEAQAVLQLIDLAVKNAGMQVAKAAVIITEKIGMQLQQPTPPVENQNSTNPEIPMPEIKKEDKK